MSFRLPKFFLLLILFASQNISAQKPVNWTSDQLMQPSELAVKMKDKKNAPVIFSVGPAAIIPGSKEIGMVKDEANLKKFKEALASIPRNTKIVVYCGCCPYEHCPDVRPAMETLKEMKFTNYSLLDLPHNIKTDWINKGYPTQSGQ